MNKIIISDDILGKYREVEQQRINIANKIEQYGDIYICEFNRLTDRLEKLDLEYQRLKNIEKCLGLAMKITFKI